MSLTDCANTAVRNGEFFLLLQLLLTPLTSKYFSRAASEHRPYKNCSLSVSCWLNSEPVKVFNSIKLIQNDNGNITDPFRINWLRHTLLPRTFYSSGTVCIVNFSSKEQFASNWHVTVCSLTLFCLTSNLNTLYS